MKQYGRSYVLILGITFAELTLGLLILGVKRFVLIALLIAILDIFPVLGTGTVLIPWAVIALIQGSIGRGIGLLVLYAVITVIRQVIEPRIVGKHVGLHPLITLICMFVGTSLFGWIGLFGLPILMAILLELHNSGTLRVFRTMGEEETVQAQPLDARAVKAPPPTKEPAKKKRTQNGSR
jgi:predicted PurR-regulated permease PerM